MLFRSVGVALHVEDPLSQPPVRVNAEEALAQDDEAADVKDGVGREVVELDAVRVHQPPDEFVNRKGESPVHEVDEADALAVAGMRGHLIAGRLRRHLLQRRQDTVAAQRLQLALGHGRPLPVAANLLQPAGRAKKK